eukprot:5936878-Pleurochrysis_carterae.AAC.2
MMRARSPASGAASACFLERVSSVAARSAAELAAALARAPPAPRRRRTPPRPLLNAPRPRPRST